MKFPPGKGVADQDEFSPHPGKPRAVVGQVSHADKRVGVKPLGMGECRPIGAHIDVLSNVNDPSLRESLAEIRGCMVGPFQEHDIGPLDSALSDRRDLIALATRAYELHIPLDDRVSCRADDLHAMPERDEVLGMPQHLHFGSTHARLGNGGEREPVAKRRFPASP